MTQPSPPPDLPPRPPRPFAVHWLVDAAVTFLAVVIVALIWGVPLVPLAIAALVVGAIAAPFTRRAEIRALEARDAAAGPDPRPHAVSTGPDPEARNRAFWDADADGYQAAHGAALADAPEAWGVWRIPEATLGVLGDVTGLDVLEYGCGGAQFGLAIAARGAHVVGIDLAAAQLGHARRHALETATRLQLVCASATATPFADAAFDLVFCDHGAMSFCDPAATVPECARLLRDGGRLVFSVGTQLLYLTWDETKRRQTRHLRAPWQPRWVVDSDEGTVDVIWSHGEWIRTLRAHGFVVDDLVELLAPEGATTTYDFAPYQWARRWPAEEIWCATRRPRARR